MTEPQHIKLSEVAHTTGIPADTLKIMVADDLLAGAVRGRGGHIYFRQGETPTWSDCIELLREQRDRHLRRAASALRRLETELEAVRNDINEAREHPRDALGIDMMSFGHWPHDRIQSTLRGQPLITVEYALAPGTSFRGSGKVNVAGRYLSARRRPPSPRQRPSKFIARF